MALSFSVSIRSRINPVKTGGPKDGWGRGARRNTVLLLAAALALGIVAWTATVLTGGHRFAIPAP